MAEKNIQATGIPFWSWNDKLNADKLVKQVNEMKANGYGGFIMHARSGLKTEYLKSIKTVRFTLNVFSRTESCAADLSAPSTLRTTITAKGRPLL